MAFGYNPKRGVQQPVLLQFAGIVYVRLKLFGVAIGLDRIFFFLAKREMQVQVFHSGQDKV